VEGGGRGMRGAEAAAAAAALAGGGPEAVRAMRALAQRRLMERALGGDGGGAEASQRGIRSAEEMKGSGKAEGRRKGHHDILMYGGRRT